MQKGKKLSKFTSGKKMSKGSRAKKDAAVFCNPEMEKQANAEPKRISLSRSDDEPCVVVESPLPLIYYIFHLETMKDIGWIAKCSIIARKKSDLAMKDEVEEGGQRTQKLSLMPGDLSTHILRREHNGALLQNGKNLQVALNTDAAIASQDKKVGLGFIIKDSAGSFVAIVATNCLGDFHPKLAEAISIREALKWLKARSMDYVQIETDSLLVIQGLNNGSKVFYFDLMLEDIRVITNDFNHISFSFVKRFANMAVYEVA
nr:uncharacterized protein LOC109155154 [Ipomoea batatas]GME13682.1 uncharacterized protein LOC109155154 [Ipomoea batatas]